MALRERTVTGTIVDGDGSPVFSAKVQFKPTKPVGYTSTHIVVDRTFTATTDNAGLFSITLWCDEDSLTPVDYTVTFPTANNGEPDASHTATISLSYEDGSSKDIGTLIAESTDVSEIVSETTLADLIDERIGTMDVRTIAGTSDTPTASDAGMLLKTTSGSAVTITLSDTLPVGFQCLVEQDGAGQITFAAGAGVTIRNRQGHTKTAGQYASASVLKVGAGEFRLQGDTTT